MSDSESIIRLLKAAEKRVRGNRMVQEIAYGLAIALVLPVLFKILDFFVGFRLTTVAIFFAVWGIITLVWLVWRTRGLGESLQKVAASLDSRSSGHDQIKTAYWFIRNPKESDWVDVQIQRAAASARSMAVNSLYPRQLPRASYMAIGLILLLGLLNFAPLPWNKNWLLGEGAPAFTLDDADKAALQHALELLKKAEELQKTDLAEKLAQIIRALQEGGMSKDQLSKSLSDLQNAIAERNLDAGQITDGLERIAKALDPSQLTKPTAKEIFKLDLNKAADEVRTLEKNLPSQTEPKLNEMAERFQEASDVAGQGLEQLSQHLANTAAAMKRRDTAAGQQGLRQVATELERLQRVLESQRLQAEAGGELSGVSAQQIAPLRNSRLDPNVPEQRVPRRVNGRRFQGPDQRDLAPSRRERRVIEERVELGDETSEGRHHVTNERLGCPAQSRFEVLEPKVGGRDGDHRGSQCVQSRSGFQLAQPARGLFPAFLGRGQERLHRS